MKRYRIFIVNDETWEEHRKVGIAAINDPLTTHAFRRFANGKHKTVFGEFE